jgi:hypothetical protein
MTGLVGPANSRTGNDLRQPHLVRFYVSSCSLAEMHLENLKTGGNDKYGAGNDVGEFRTNIHEGQSVPKNRQEPYSEQDAPHAAAATGERDATEQHRR